MTSFDPYPIHVHVHVHLYSLQLVLYAQLANSSLVSPVLLIELLFPKILSPDYCSSPFLLSPHLGLVLGRERTKSNMLLPLTEGTAEEGVVETALRDTGVAVELGKYHSTMATRRTCTHM